MLDSQGRLHETGAPKLTFSGIGVFRHELLANWHTVIGDTPDGLRKPPRFKLVELLRAAIAHGVISGSQHHGQWTDVGTPERLQTLDTQLRDRTPDSA
jgi:MurNAc alpha-1-phosphate uridylyltransferase